MFRLRNDRLSQARAGADERGDGCLRADAALRLDHGGGRAAAAAKDAASLHGDGRPAHRVAIGMGRILALYGACEVTSSVWYARHYWPVYHRYLRLETARGAPDLQTPRPLQPQAQWPDYPRW